MQNVNNNTTDDSNDIGALETEIRNAVAQGSCIQDAVQHLTLKAMNANSLDFESLRRIITAVIQGAHEGAHQQLQHATNQSQTAKTQITEAITGLDAALAKFAAASMLAVEEATGRAQKFSDNELSRTSADLESLENLFLETLHHTARTTKGFIADTLHDLVRHAQNNGTAVGEQIKETLLAFTQQMASVGHTQLDAGVHLTHATADLIHKTATGILMGINNQTKSEDKPQDH
tara:strand:+ start:446 stop:1144 length:699 start_codon:yes stop_codon:yes gene_type:complete